MAGKEQDPRRLMELAVAVMHESRNEPRKDGKACPLVGCVLRLPDGRVDTCSRGELRYGDHAEYAVLERKNRAEKLDGSLLFATLEPCAPGSRRHPKLSCAERIVLARISEVWIGIEDPDPKVDRKGIKYLQESGVKVHMFDRDLQDQIAHVNRAFIDSALERAARAKEPPKPPTLSSLEFAVASADTSDFSGVALESYRRYSNIDDAVDSRKFVRSLEQQGLMAEKDGKLRPTGFGLLLFGKVPRDAMTQAGLLATIHYADGYQETEDFVGPAVLIPGEVQPWLDAKLPNVLDRSRAESARIPAVPYVLVREAIVNALVHRDYDIEGAKCQLIVTPDVITVQSPGAPVPPVTLASLQDFSAPMLSRNPSLHYVFGRMALAEERGFGMQTFRDVPDKFGLPLPRYTFEDPYLSLTIYRSMVGAELSLPQHVLGSLSKAERQGWQWLSKQLAVTSEEYAAARDLPSRTALNHLKRFADLGLVRKVGAGRATRYEVHRALRHI